VLNKVAAKLVGAEHGPLAGGAGAGAGGGGGGGDGGGEAGLPVLSHVQRIVEEAQSVPALAAMFSGWTAWA
jgi:hypothetical protein